MEKDIRQQKITDYIYAYNHLDVPGMLAVLHPEIEFKHIPDGEVTMSTKGLDEFRSLAENVLPYFSERTQTITNILVNDQQVEVMIDYMAIFANDMPSGEKAGDKLELKGKSVFRFKDDLINVIEDIS